MMAEEYLRSQGSQKGRSASICVAGCSSMESVMVPPASGMSRAPRDDSANSTPRSRRRVAAARSQSARVVGSRPRVKRRDAREQSPHLDLAGSEPRIQDAEADSYNPFLRKVPSSGRLLLSDGTKGLPPTAPLYYNDNNTSPEDSPVLARHATVRKVAEKPPIPVITTPENSPTLTRSKTCKGTRTPTQNRAAAEKSPSFRSKDTGPRRVHSFKSNQRKSSYLDVPDSPRITNGNENDEAYILRSFSFNSKGGIINRGDSFRRRRSRSNSLIPLSALQDSQQSTTEDITDKYFTKSATPPSSPACKEPRRKHSRPPPPQGETSSYNVVMLGAPGVGKTALISQFMTSECINAYDRQRGQSDDESEQSVYVMLNGEESELVFVNIANPKLEFANGSPPDAFVVMYSVIDKTSFQKAETELERLQDWESLRNKAIIVVGNKVDLVRSRAVSTQDGKCLACTYRTKFTEISVGINHNVDELLVGILSQIRLKDSQDKHQAEKEYQAHWYKSRGVVRASMKARQVFTWLFGKEDSKFRNCENLHVL